MTTKRIRMERSYRAPIEDVWDLWTTKSGIESWWGPEGFSVTVTKLDLKPGGELRYDMTAIGPEQVAFMKQAGAPITTHAWLKYTEVERHRRLGYLTVADFIPGVTPYDVATTVELTVSKGVVRMVLEFDPMHDELWTNRAVQGHASELLKLDRALAAKGGVRV
jgi:uncharacterized protein YndB with AHSA1/START domain